MRHGVTHMKSLRVPYLCCSVSAPSQTSKGRMNATHEVDQLSRRAIHDEARGSGPSEQIKAEQCEVLDG